MILINSKKIKEKFNHQKTKILEIESQLNEKRNILKF